MNRKEGLGLILDLDTLNQATKKDYVLMDAWN